MVRGWTNTMTQMNAIQGFDEIYRHAVRNTEEECIEGIEKLTETYRE